MYLLHTLCDSSNDRILKDKNKLLVVMQGKSQRDAFFGHRLANMLINGSGKVQAKRDRVKELFNEIDAKALAENLNNLELTGFSTFGELLGRISFFDPTWKNIFTELVVWNRIVKIINNCSATDANSVDDLVVPLSRLAADGKNIYSHQYVIDILPFIDNAMADNPWDTYARLRAIYWNILDHAVKFLRHSQPIRLQIELATRTLQNVDTTQVAN